MTTVLAVVGVIVYIFIGIVVEATLMEEDGDPFDNAWMAVIWPLIIAGFVVFGFCVGAFKLGKYINNKIFKKK